MQRRICSDEHKLEAVKLQRERGVSVAQVASDMDVQKVPRVSLNHCHLSLVWQN